MRSVNPDQLRAKPLLQLVPNRLSFMDASETAGGATIAFAKQRVLKFKQMHVIIVTSSAVVAQLLENGRTEHFKFQIPISVDQNSTCNVSIEDPRAADLR